MQKAQEDVKTTFNETVEYAKKEATDFVEEIKATKPVDAGVAFGVALLLSIALHIATKQKEDSILTFGVFFYSLLAGFAAVVLRKKVPREQFITLVVAFSVCRLIVEVQPLPVLILSATPAIVNIAAEEVKKHVKTQ